MSQKGRRCPRVAVPLQFHPLYLAALQAHRRVVTGLLPIPGTGGLHQRRLALQHPFAPQFGVGPEVGLVGKECLGSGPLGLIPQGSVLRHKGLTLGLISLDQTLLGTLEGKSQAVQVVQATAAAQAGAKALRDNPVNHPPVPVGQLNACLPRQFLHRCLQLRLLRLAKGGGEPPLCSNIKALGPPCPKAATHRPMVCGSRSKASAVADAVHPWASSSMAYHLSRSRGVGARIIRRRKSWASICHCSRYRSMSLAPITNPSSTYATSYPSLFTNLPYPSAHFTLALV